MVIRLQDKFHKASAGNGNACRCGYRRKACHRGIEGLKHQLKWIVDRDLGFGRDFKPKAIARQINEENLGGFGRAIVLRESKVAKRGNDRSNTELTNSPQVSQSQYSLEDVAHVPKNVVLLFPDRVSRADRGVTARGTKYPSPTWRLALAS
jgi:hypothetical protein